MTQSQVDERETDVNTWNLYVSGRIALKIQKFCCHRRLEQKTQTYFSQVPALNEFEQMCKLHIIYLADAFIHSECLCNQHILNVLFT